MQRAPVFIPGDRVRYHDPILHPGVGTVTKILRRGIWDDIVDVVWDDGHTHTKFFFASHLIKEADYVPDL